MGTQDVQWCSIRSANVVETIVLCDTRDLDCLCKTTDFCFYAKVVNCSKVRIRSAISYRVRDLAS